MLKIERIYWFFIISLFLFLFDIAGLTKGIFQSADNIVMPLKNSIYQTNIMFRSLSLIIRQYPLVSQIAENNSLLSKINQELNLETKLLKEENIKLRMQLDAPLPPTFQFIPANVISVSRYMEVMAGEKEKVKTGMVVVDGMTLVGKVIETGSTRSKVIIPNDPDMDIPAKTVRGTKGRITGQSGGSVILDKVLQKEQLFIDDIVVTSGEGDYPPNLIIGKVLYINADDVSPYKQARITPSVDYSLEKTVFIIPSL